MTKPLSFSSNQNLPRLGISPTGYIVPDTLDEHEDWYGRLSLILKTDDEFLIFRYLNDLLKIENNTPAVDRSKNVNAHLAFIAEMRPSDHVEIQLILQMIATHSKAISSLSSDKEKDQKSAARLLSLYNRQVEALNRYRKKGLQKIIVERVTVQNGGQAIVGSVGDRGLE